MSRWLTTAEAAAELGFSAETLRKWRQQGVGPQSFKIRNRVFYETSALIRWRREQADANE